MKSIVLSAISISIISVSSCGQQTNSASKNISTSSSAQIKVCREPGCIEAADLNHDKHTDLVITSQVDSTVTILIGNGNAAFVEATGSPFPAGPNVNDVTIGDFNNDSHSDLAFANHERKYLSVLIGDGNGRFMRAPQSPFSVTGIPHTHGIATGDFNNDGRLDLVTDSWGNDEVEVLFGDSANLFKAGVFYKVGKHPYQRVRAADVNKDGIDDIVTTNSEGNNVTVLLGNSNGELQQSEGSPFPCGDAPFGVAIGDVNGDGNPDLAIVNSPVSMAEGSGKNGMTVLLGDGKGKFSMTNSSPYDAGRIPNRIAIGDINGDGINDIVTSDNDTDRIYLFFMNRNGVAESTSSLVVGNHPKDVAITDLNGDGKGEIITCNTADDNISIIRQK